MDSNHYILKDKKVIVVDLMTWADWVEKEKGSRIVKQETLPNGKWVSTVFLGLNHNYGEGLPLLFETMVFPSAKGLGAELDVDRYSTYEEAEKGHSVLVQKWSLKRKAIKGRRIIK